MGPGKWWLISGFWGYTVFRPVCSPSSMHAVFTVGDHTDLATGKAVGWISPYAPTAKYQAAAHHFFGGLGLGQRDSQWQTRRAVTSFWRDSCSTGPSFFGFFGFGGFFRPFFTWAFSEPRPKAVWKTISSCSALLVTSPVTSLCPRLIKQNLEVCQLLQSRSEYPARSLTLRTQDNMLHGSPHI